MSVTTAFTENKGVRPCAPFAFHMHPTFGATDDAVDQGAAAGEADAAGTRVEIEELAIGNVAHGDDLIHALRIAGEN